MSPRSERRYTWNGVFDLYLWSEDNSKELEKGWIVSADTLEELGAKMVTSTPLGDTVTCDGAGLAEAVAAYNEACDAGKDELGRPAESLQKIGDGPYYAIELCDGAMYASGGPATDTDFQVVGSDGQPLSRLYAAGTVSFALLNSNNVTSFSTGIKCAQNIVALKPWE